MRESRSIEEWKRVGGLGTVDGRTPDDVFVVCASFEDRASATVECLSDGYHARLGIIYASEEFRNETSQAGSRVQLRLDAIRGILERRCDRVVTAQGSWMSPASQLSALRSVLPAGNDFLPVRAITIDTTTFTRETLLIAAAVLRQRFRDAALRVTYVQPTAYGEWLSRGFQDTRNVLGFPGVQHASRPTVLTVLSGFEPERTLRIIEEYEPSLLLLGFGTAEPPHPFHTRNISDQQAVMLARQDHQRFDFPAYDIGGCAQTIETLLSPYWDGCNVVVAPMSTKLSTLSTFVVACAHSELQITYCVPGEYNVEGYTRGADRLLTDEITCVVDQ
jgi:hypothetical protein